MKSLVMTLTVWVAGMFLTTVALANDVDDVDDVKAAVQSYFTSLNTGDADAYVQVRMSEHSAFARGELLTRFHSLAEQTKLLRTSIDAGEKGDLQLRNLEVKVYHDNTAVVTGYVVGTRPSPDGIRVPIRDQRTEVWIKQGEQWKQVHRHSSPLLLPQ